MKDTTEDKITIIEGPSPTFEIIEDGWALGLNEGPYLHDLALTRLRAFNGPALVERCRRAWKKQTTITLEYRDDMGLEQEAPIVAARSLEANDGYILLLWVLREPQEVEAEADMDDFDDFDDDEDESSLS